ncbi:tip elongation aberrant protein 1-like isoform X1 [Senna tora]|uniref:Tip elongation aberrant protein 1-like isoform X1 n=1 Tax=Senna tora TaxID=362788 RepID=A0A834SN42_9FABA|nr:tip elongation aberrant protein 1-like isoform X1 [Senna tora]
MTGSHTFGRDWQVKSVSCTEIARKVLDEMDRWNWKTLRNNGRSFRGYVLMSRLTPYRVKAKVNEEWVSYLGQGGGGVTPATPSKEADFSMSSEVQQTWSQPVIKGTPPTPRDSHSCTAVGDNLFVFGGTDGVNPLKDLHILDTSSHTWISPTIRGEGPEAREGHSSALVGKRLFIFGGCGKSIDNNEVYYNDLYILNTETFVWKCAATSGTPPSPRDSHTCSSWKNKVVVIGGEDRNDYYLSDVHILDTDTLIWRELSPSGQLLSPRAGHSAVSFGKNLFVFGGFTDAQSLYNDLYMLDVDTGIWSKVITTGNGPSPRFSVTGDCLDPIMGGVLVFIGGCNKNLEALDDMYYLYTGLARESEQRPEKLSLRKQLKLKCQEQNLYPIQNRGLATYGVADISQPLTVLNYNHPSKFAFIQLGRQNIPANQSVPSGKKMFQAKLTHSVTEGYTIETVIDGKPLRGFLFSNKANSLQPSTHTSSSRKRVSCEPGSVVSNGIRPDKLKVSKVLKQNEKADGVHGDASTFLGTRQEAVPALISSIPTTSDTFESHKVVASLVPEIVALNQDDKKDDTPKSLGENLRNDAPSSRSDVPIVDQTTHFPSLNYEVPRHDQSSHAPYCSAEVPKSAAAEHALNLSNHDCSSSTPMIEERSEPAKFI